MRHEGCGTVPFGEMNWKQRFRELVIAGGLAGTSAGCAGQTATQPLFRNDGGSVGGGEDAGPEGFCCNAASDPCCE